LPVYNKSQDRAVSGSDYKNLADIFVTPYNGVMGKASAILRHGGCAANIIDLFVLAKSGSDGLQTASSEFKAELIEYMNDRKMLTDFLCVRDGVIIGCTVSIDVILDKYYRTFEDDIRAKIERNMAIFFNLVNWDYGQTLRDTDVIKGLSSVTEPYRYEVSLTTADPLWLIVLE